MKGAYTLPAAAKATGLSYSQLKRSIERGTVAADQTARVWLVPASEVDRINVNRGMASTPRNEAADALLRQLYPAVLQTMKGIIDAALAADGGEQ